MKIDIYELAALQTAAVKKQAEFDSLRAQYNALNEQFQTLKRNIGEEAQALFNAWVKEQGGEF